MLYLAGLLFPSPAVMADVIEVRVVEVTEGDALVVEEEGGDRHRIALACIDAPESDQPFGTEARLRLQAWAAGRPARFEREAVDRHGRAVGTLWVTSPDMPCRAEPDCPKNLDLGHALIASGLAWHAEGCESGQSAQARASYAFDEQEARARGVGLWSDPDAIAPWAWRQGRRVP